MALILCFFHRTRLLWRPTTWQWLKIDLMSAEYRLPLLSKTDSPCSAVSAIAELLVIFVGWLMEIVSSASGDFYVTACVTRYDICERAGAQTMVGSGDRCCVVTWSQTLLSLHWSRVRHTRTGSVLTACVRQTTKHNSWAWFRRVSLTTDVPVTLTLMTMDIITVHHSFWSDWHAALRAFSTDINIDNSSYYRHASNTSCAICKL